MSVKSTRLRFIVSKTASGLSDAVSLLPFKVEIKGAPVFSNKKWYLWFVIPDNEVFKNTELP